MIVVDRIVLGPLQKHIEVLTPGVGECDLIWK